MYLPEEFLQKYKAVLGNEAEQFVATFQESPIAAYRVNPLKSIHLEGEQPIPQTPWGFYGKVSGKSPEHVTGVVYSQEPAAQMVGQVAAPQPGMRVLDLAAAPGGKSTHLLSYLQNTGVLVSNEISPKRSKILVENIERFGARNVVVTNESAERLSTVFQHYFDVIVFDGPCSGEGMFRKDHDAVEYWHQGYPTECSILQKSILENTISMLAKGGRLVYSTCTWSIEENEQVVQWLLDHYDFLELIDIPKINGMVAGINQPESARMYPHLFKGEGQFVAHFQDTRPPEVINVKSPKSNVSREQMTLWEEFSKQHLKIDLSGNFQVFGDQLYLLPLDLPDLKGLKIARNGLHLGTFKKNRFEPAFALGLAISPNDIVQSVEIDIEQFKLYVSGNTVSLSSHYSTGWYQVVVNGNGLGFAKIVGNTLKNYYPKGLRFYS